MLVLVLGGAAALKVVSRRALGATAAATAAAVPRIAAAKDRSEGYAVRKSERDWQGTLSGPEYFVLRSGGTEPPNSSPLVHEKRDGEFRCAGCGAPLFASTAKFESGTGWPSFSAGLPDVAVEPTFLELLSGTEIRCGKCGGHLGDRFLDGALFPGTSAMLTGRRYCVDGTAVVFHPADGSPPVRGEFEPNKPREIPEWARPPGIKVSG